MENNQNILKEKSNINVSLKLSDPVKDVDMDQQHQIIHEKENYNPKSLKEMTSAGSETDLNKADPVTTNESTTKSANTTFDQTSDDESYISTNDNLSFLTDGFNNIKLDAEAHESIATINSSMTVDPAQSLETTSNKTLTESSPPTNTTFTGETFHVELGEKEEDPQIYEEKVIEDENQKTNDTFPDDKSQESEFYEKVETSQNNEEKLKQEPKDTDTLDEITSVLADQSYTEQKKENLETLSPILAPEISNDSQTVEECHSNASHEINLTSSITFDNSNEENLFDAVTGETNNDVNQEPPTALPEPDSTDEHATIAFSSTFAMSSESATYLTAPTPMEIDETFNDDVQAPTANEEQIEPQQKFEEKFVPGLDFEFKIPEASQQSSKSEILEAKMNTDSSIVVADVVEKRDHTEETQDEFKIPGMSTKRFSVEDFENAASYNFGNFDLDILQRFGNNPTADFSIGRDSVLLRFDPLLEKIAPIDTQVNQQITPTTTTTRLPSTKEEDEQYSEGQNSSDKPPQDTLTPVASSKSCISSSQLPSNAENGAMKDLDQGNETIESLAETKEFKDTSDNNQQLLLQQQKIEYEKKMTELESQLRKEAEIKEEALLKRITEKEKQMAKMNNVVEAYEKAIAELIAEKEQLTQSYEKKCSELKNDSETNSHHLASLESTFSDLHAKYERTKQIASELKDREEAIVTDRRALQDSLKLQEARYEKMKTHAMSQLEIANTKLAEMQRNHQAESTKLKAQLKKEEISRASITEQLNQKSKENAELVKICDELIGNHGHSQNA